MVNKNGTGQPADETTVEIKPARSEWHSGKAPHKGHQVNAIAMDSYEQVPFLLRQLVLSDFYVREKPIDQIADDHGLRLEWVYRIITEGFATH